MRRSITHRTAIRNLLAWDGMWLAIATVQGMDDENDAAVAATATQTREALLKRQARGYTQVRSSLVQRHVAGPNGERSALLAQFVGGRKHRALVLYLLLLGAWPEVEHRITNGRSPLEAKVWLRALSSHERGALTWSTSTLSRTWRELETMQLLTRERRGRLVYTIPRREDALADYSRPRGRRGHEHSYFVLPDTFWTDEVFARLGLAALAMFLLIAKETNNTDEEYFTFQQFEDWYGIRQRTAQKGIAELQDKGLLHVRREPVPAELSGIGYTVRTHYSLRGGFGHQDRSALRARAQRATRKNPARQSAKKKLKRAAARAGTTAAAKAQPNRAPAGARVSPKVPTATHATTKNESTHE